MARLITLVIVLVHIFICSTLCFGSDPTAYYDLKFSYITASPLGVPQQVIAVNKKFPGPLVNVTTNYNVVVNVWNELDENLLLTWSGIQMRHNSWEDGVLGTNCPIPPKWNWTYEFQVKDQIGSFFYFPSLNFQRASGGYGPVIINNRVIISLPFAQPDGDFNFVIGDWYTQNHTALRRMLNSGKELGMPDGVLINGKGPFKYNSSVPDGIDHATFNVDPGKTLNSTKKFYTSEKVNVMFLMQALQKKPLYDVSTPWSAMNQPRSIRQNGTASGARPNPQGSFHYGQINVTQTYVLQSLPPTTIDGKLKSTINGISFVNPDTPIRLADKHNVKGAYKMDFPDKPSGKSPRMDRSIINATYKGFIEVILQNNDTKMLSFHADGYSFFVVGMDIGIWTENSRGQYNKWDGISRSTIEVYPGGWTAVLFSLDNTGVWNLRVENLDRWYLGHETYMRIVNPEENGETEEAPPANVLYCGALKSLQKAQEHSSATTTHLNLFLSLAIGLFSLALTLV
ncbi:hypothetical protein ACFE04_027882 [Oxalis oulophora]